MDAEQWMAKIDAAFKCAKQEMSLETRAFLESDWTDEPTQEQKKTYFGTMELVLRYFFEKAANGETFGSADRITKEFGRPVEENYGVSAGVFADVARTFWTFKLEVQDLFPKSGGTIMAGLLSQLERTIAGTFFPFPGPIQDSVPVSERVKAQREILEEYAPGIDADRFIAENPMLR